MDLIVILVCFFLVVVGGIFIGNWLSKIDRKHYLNKQQKVINTKKASNSISQKKINKCILPNNRGKCIDDVFESIGELNLQFHMPIDLD